MAGALAFVVLAGLPTLATAEKSCVECVAPSGGSSGGSGSQTVAFLGLQWSFGASSPEVTTGVRYVRADDDGLVFGAQADAAFPLLSDSFAPTIRLLGLAGNEDVQAQAGVGYDFSTALPLVAVGAQVSYLNAGANIELGGGVKPYVGINSLTKPSLAAGGTEVTCPTDYLKTSVEISGDDAYIEDGTILVPPDRVVGGYTCIQNG